MTTVFIGGSRRITRLNEAVTRRLNTIAEKQIPVLVGDANGADKAVQAHFGGMGYARVTVYCTGDTCRNNVGGWPVTRIQPTGSGRRKDRKFFTLKDRAMSARATHGLMLWDGVSLGTLVNVVRLRREGRPAVVYVQPSASFVDVKEDGDLAKLAKYSASELLIEAQHAVAAEECESAPGSENLPLFQTG